MNRTPLHAPIRKVQTSLPREMPFGLAALERIGMSAQVAAHYAESGWLDRLGQGVMRLPVTP